MAYHTTMKKLLATTAELRDALKRLGPGGVRTMSERSGVPLQTIYSIRSGQTKDASLETATKLTKHMLGVMRTSTRRLLPLRAKSC